MCMSSHQAPHTALSSLGVISLPGCSKVESCWVSWGHKGWH